MKNIDKIKEMSPKELIIFMNSNKCDRCTYNNTNCMHDMCSEGMRAWLEQEDELTCNDVDIEFNNFCNATRCRECNLSGTGCRTRYYVDNFNIIDGKITRRQK